MRYAVYAASLIVLCTISLPAPAQMEMKHIEPPRTITVAGSGHVSGVPDKARVQLNVQKSNASMDKARADALAVVNRFLALTKKLGIDQKKVRTTGTFINPEYRWVPETNQQILTGYMVQRQLEVEVTDLDKLGTLIEGAVDAGVNNVSPPMLDSSKRTDLNRQALAAAGKDALANAQAIADTLGVKLGGLRQLTAGDAAPPQPMPVVMMAAKAEAMDAGGAASYSTGSLEFEARVNATFDVLP